jgi:hypothetical protein
MEEVIEVEKESKELFSKDSLYIIKDIMKDHCLTANQALYLLCQAYDIEYDAESKDLASLYNKGLLTKGHTVNLTLLFHLKKVVQLTLDLPFNSKPKGTSLTLDRADRIEKEFVIDIFLIDEEKKRIADEYFKGDQTQAKYFIIFKSLFPTVKKYNLKWNKKFGFTYEGMNLWDDSPRVAKKFTEIYKKLDIGIFLEATYRRVKESIDLEQERCFMTKPYKHMLAFSTYYRQVEDDLKSQVQRSDKETEEKIDKLKV